MHLRHVELQQPREDGLLLEQPGQTGREDVGQQRVHRVREPQEGALLVRLARRLLLGRRRQQRRTGDQVHALAVAERRLVQREGEEHRAQRVAAAVCERRLELQVRARQVLVHLVDDVRLDLDARPLPELEVAAARERVSPPLAESAELDPVLGGAAGGGGHRAWPDPSSQGLGGRRASEAYASAGHRLAEH